MLVRQLCVTFCSWLQLLITWLQGDHLSFTFKIWPLWKRSKKHRTSSLFSSCLGKQANSLTDPMQKSHKGKHNLKNPFKIDITPNCHRYFSLSPCDSKSLITIVSNSCIFKLLLIYWWGVEVIFGRKPIIIESVMTFVTDSNSFSHTTVWFT